MEKFKNNFFDETEKIWNSYDIKVSHIKFEWNRRQKNCFFQRYGIFLIFKKSSKGPLNQKKIFVFDSTQILCVKSLGHKDCIFWISSKSETKIFHFSKGGTLWCFSDFQNFNIQTLIDIDGQKLTDRLVWMLK